MTAGTRAGRLFGTDGIRGVANRDLTPELLLQVGRALVNVLGRGGIYLVGRDTRLSGPMLEAAITAGICAGGGDVERGGILPTPAVAFLTHRLGRPGGIVLSASHNPIEDNGVKVFGPDGFKFPDEVEDRIEAALGLHHPHSAGAGVGQVRDLPQAEDLYLEYLLGLGLRPQPGLRLVVDCAYGAAHRIAPRLWQALGADVTALHAEADGARINVGCGSTHPAPLREAVRASGAQVGFAHDGDADRVIAVDERGEIVDGDIIMAICARYLAARGALPGATVVATVMSNMGLERLLADAGIRLERTRVGDRYVLERMQQTGAALGGEQSGHVIFLDKATTGDGLVTALHLAHIMRETGQPLSQLADGFFRFPQVLRNVRVADRAAWEDDTEVRAAIAAAGERLGRRGRILVRASGTEPLVRVMVEAEEAEEADGVARAVADVITRRHGGPVGGKSRAEQYMGMFAAAQPSSPVDLLGVPVHPLTLVEAVSYLDDSIARRRPATVVSLNGALLMRALREPQVRDAVRAATLVIPDGIGVLLAARILGVPAPRRVAGADLAERLCAAVAPRRGRVFLLGGAPGVADTAAAELRLRCPGLDIAGTAHGFFRPEEEPALLARIRRAAPDILLVALGAPRQEEWMRRYAPSLSVPVAMGVGGTLDVLAGRTRRAPRWVQRAGLEWLYRMAREPWRWSVVRTIPPLFFLALRARLRGRGGRLRGGGLPGTGPGGRRNENRSEHPTEDRTEKEVKAASE